MYRQVARGGHDGPMRAPLWQQIAADLREQIATEAYAPGDELPSEQDLRTRYDVSRNTVRQALRALITEGLITSGQGRPYQVTDTRPMTLDASRHETLSRIAEQGDGDAYTHEVEVDGREARQELRVELAAAPAGIAERLGIQAGKTTVRRRCLRFVDGIPWSVQDTHYPMRIAEGTRLAEPGDIAEGTTRYLDSRGIRQVRYHDEWTARMPSPADAAELQIGPGVPLMIWVRTGYDADGQPVRVTTTTLRSDRNRVTYDIDNDEDSEQQA